MSYILEYKTYLVMLFASALGSLLLTPVARRLAFRWGAVDQPSPRKIHKIPMPRLGGLAVFLGFCLPWGGLYMLHKQVSITFQNYEKLCAALILGAFSMLLLGIYDDIKGANAFKKFLVQIITAIGLWMAGFRIEVLSNPFGEPLALGFFSLPISVLWIVGVTNAINLLDGIDGLVAGVTACIALSLAIINGLSGNILLSLLTLCLAGACLGFLPYNHSPARIFLGDSGSLTVGLVLGCIGIISLFAESARGASPFISVPLILFGLPLFDTARVMIKRYAAGASMFKADKNHVHHRLLQLGFNQRQAAWTLYGVAATTGAVSIFLTLLPQGRQFLISALFALLAAGVYLIWRFRVRPNVEDDSDAQS